MPGGVRMLYLEALICLLIIALGALQLFLARAQVRVTQEAVAFLDQHLAEVIQTTLERLPESLQETVAAAEPMNPIQMMIAQVLQDKLQSSTVTAQIIPQDSQGRFKKLDDFQDEKTE